MPRYLNLIVKTKHQNITALETSFQIGKTTNMSTTKTNKETAKTPPPAKKTEAVRLSQKELKKKAKKEYEANQKTKDKSATGKEIKTDLKKKNLDTAAKTKDKAESTERESKYKYPADCESDNQRKTFRRNARNKKKAFETSIATLKVSEDKDAKSKLKTEEAAFNTFMEETYNPQE
jgi:hypothetical protein